MEEEDERPKYIMYFDIHGNQQWALSDEAEEEEKRRERDEQGMIAKLTRERETREKEREMLDEH